MNALEKTQTASNFIDSLFTSAVDDVGKIKTVALVKKEEKVLVKKRLTKKEKKIREQESDDRLICAIISDTKAGKSVLKDDDSNRKRINKAKVKTETAEDKAIK